MATTTTVLQFQDAAQGGGQPTFADVVYVLTTPPPDSRSKTWGLRCRAARYAALFAYSLAHPKQLALWANDAWRIRETIEDATYPEIRHEWAIATKEKVTYASAVARLLLFAPQGPEERAREVFAWPNPVYGPPEDGMVRIKWYPDLEATKTWPVGLGELWTDVPMDCHGSVDLKSVMGLWGLENCYVIDANRDKPQLWRRPASRLSALALKVLLDDGHKVIGVVERPSEPTLTARRYRSSLKHFLLDTLPLYLWRIMAHLALVLTNLLVGVPYALFFLLRASPYILFHTLEIVFLVIFAIGTLVVDDIEELADAVQECVAPPLAWGLGAVREWAVAGLEAAFLTDEEITSREGSEMLEE